MEPSGGNHRAMSAFCNPRRVVPSAASDGIASIPAAKARRRKADPWNVHGISAVAAVRKDRRKSGERILEICDEIMLEIVVSSVTDSPRHPWKTKFRGNFTLRGPRRRPRLGTDLRAVVQRGPPPQRLEVRHPRATPPRRGCRHPRPAPAALRCRPRSPPRALERADPRLATARCRPAQPGTSYNRGRGHAEGSLIFATSSLTPTAGERSTR